MSIDPEPACRELVEPVEGHAPLAPVLLHMAGILPVHDDSLLEMEGEAVRRVRQAHRRLAQALSEVERAPAFARALR